MLLATLTFEAPTEGGDWDGSRRLHRERRRCGSTIAGSSSRCRLPATPGSRDAAAHDARANHVLPDGRARNADEQLGILVAESANDGFHRGFQLRLAPLAYSCHETLPGQELSRSPLEAKSGLGGRIQPEYSGVDRRDRQRGYPAPLRVRRDGCGSRGSGPGWERPVATPITMPVDNMHNLDYSCGSLARPYISQVRQGAGTARRGASPSPQCRRAFGKGAG